MTTFSLPCEYVNQYSHFSLLFITVLFIVRYCLLDWAGDDGWRTDVTMVPHYVRNCVTTVVTLQLKL